MSQTVSPPFLHNLRRILLACLGVGVVICAFWYFPADAIWQNRNTADFNEDVRPILNDNCLACHGGVRQSGGFSMLFASDALQVNDSGKPAIVPGNADSSELMIRVLHHDPDERMPLEKPPLAEEEIALLEQWINEGAQWDVHWAYQPVQQTPVPSPRNASWGYNAIDAFLLKRMEKVGLSPSPEADCRTLARRVSLDLIGLPPDRKDVEALCTSQTSQAYEAYVDRLLVSPHFGERWAAMWLDLARYADTRGYEKDAHRTIWAYRDWVIDAFNQDMPFDQFTIEQIAGDLLPDPTTDQLIATAFHRNTMNNDEGGTDDEEFRIASVIDRVNTTWEVWMGTTMSCVQCHGHPYDPFRQEDFYKFFAYLNNTSDADTYDEAPTLGMALDSLLAAELLAEWHADTLRIDTPSKLDTPILQELEPAAQRSSYVFNRGNWMDPGAAVQPDVPAVMHDWPVGASRDRLGLARWIVNKANPLTARVIVNRYWAELFGTGIVPSLEDFGTQGQPPSHPRLLDWLATEFMNEHNWSVKALLKQIVMSASYRQRSDVLPEHLEKDPANVWLARAPRIRLSAEQLRDQALAVSGLLSPKMYGPSVMPYQPEGIWNAPYSNAQWITSEGEDRYRRGIYTYWRRSSPYPSMLTFDSPSREVCVSRRIRTNTPLQALVTLNDPVYVEAAGALADSMLEPGKSGPEVAIRYAFNQALARDPLPGEMTVLLELYKDAYFAYEDAAPAPAPAIDEGRLQVEREAFVVVANAIMNLDEFITKS